MKTIYDRVKDVLIEQLGCLESLIVPEARIVEDLGADILDTIEVRMALEEEFGIDITDAEAELLTTVQQVVIYVTEHAEE